MIAVAAVLGLALGTFLGWTLFALAQIRADRKFDKWAGQHRSFEIARTADYSGEWDWPKSIRQLVDGGE